MPHLQDMRVCEPLHSRKIPLPPIVAAGGFSFRIFLLANFLFYSFFFLFLFCKFFLLIIISCGLLASHLSLCATF